MQFINKDTIIKTPNPILKQKSKDVKFPLTDMKREMIQNMHTYLVESNNEEIAKVKNLDPGVGIAAPQIGINLNVCIIYIEDEDGNVILDRTLINPKILKKSEKKIYLEAGEGCLSVPDKIDGYVERSEKISYEYYDLEGNAHKEEVTGFMAIVIQHEVDHLFGILYTDYINKENPFEVAENSEAI